MTANFTLTRDEIAEAIALWLSQKLDLTINPNQVTPCDCDHNEDEPDLLDSLTVIVDDLAETTKAASSPRN